ncbi:hypothetical protein [Delftia sp.]|uniref:hypothetical protein n=1 Tax=Delftia sp. TaxID=1886637 RepID=UPI00259CA1B2|nr:hypothetical protein [Delftia sp.]
MQVPVVVPVPVSCARARVGARSCPGSGARAGSLSNHRNHHRRHQADKKRCSAARGHQAQHAAPVEQAARHDLQIVLKAQVVGKIIGISRVVHGDGFS